ncbi:MAG: peptidoglycan DD-metalloendopeptidase family protein [Planctomycetota bacterium]
MPNPVIGTECSQEITINGTGFVSVPSVIVTWTGGSKTLSSSQVFFDSSTKVRISIVTKSIAGHWTVTVKNPDGTSYTSAFEVIEEQGYLLCPNSTGRCWMDGTPKVRLDDCQIAKYAKDAGFSGEALVTAIAVAYAESSFYQYVYNSTHDYGLWQINVDCHFSNSERAQARYDLLNNPAYNAQKAWEISNRGTDWTPWYTFTNELLDLQMARDIVGRCDLVDGTPPPPPVSSDLRNVIAPVIGAFRVTGPENSNCIGKAGLWTFCQHQTLGHRPGGGIGGSDDTYAYDMNLVDDADHGKLAYAVAPGQVVRYAGLYRSGGSYGSVLVEHTSPSGTYWSSYLHMDPVYVSEGTRVTENTPLGKISNVSPNLIPHHLHFVVYTGSNSQGGLRSENVEFVERQKGAGGPCNTDDDCDDADACTLDQCLSSGCEHAAMPCPEGQMCVDGDCVSPPCDPPAHAYGPSPNDGEDSAATSVILTWAEIPGASEYDVFLGPAPSLGAQGLQATVQQTRYDPTDLAPDTTYFWRVDTANDCGVTQGQVWSFHTRTVSIEPPPERPASIPNPCGTLGMLGLVLLIGSGASLKLLRSRRHRT